MHVPYFFTALAAFCAKTPEALNELKAYIQQESILTTEFRLKKNFEWALSQGYRPSKQDLALIVATCPEDTLLIKRVIEEYEINLEYVDEAGNNLLSIISLRADTTPTILYLIAAHVNPFQKNHAGISFFDKFIKTRYFKGKEEILTFLQSRHTVPQLRTFEAEIVIEKPSQSSKK